MDTDGIQKLGFNDQFRKNVDPALFDQFTIARVIAVNKNSFMISTGAREIFAELTGKFLFNTDSVFDLPTVGDWVLIQSFDDDSLAIIHEKLPRKSLLKRKTPGKKIEYQLIAANIDTAIIMQSMESDFNLRRLERYLTMIIQNDIHPIILLSKCDLISPEQIEERKNEISQTAPGIDIISFSNISKPDIDIIKARLIPGKTYCLLGSSGVGKTTLLNNLIDEELYKTFPVKEKDGRGRHTTTRRELIVLGNGAIMIDNPGMRELGIISADSAINEIFNEISEKSENCRYADCTHTVEQGCAILEAVRTGEISESRYNNYLKMFKESQYNEMSYLEKRQKDKKIGKFIHNYYKNKKDGK